MGMTVGSLFAGIGGFDLGFERAGFTTAWQVEINDWCRKVLAKNFPHAERYADITERFLWDDEGFRPINHDLCRVDVIVGGFPCQDISNAGLRAGIEGARSGLWSEMCRIIGELRPRFVLVENVAALLGRGMGRVLGDLSEIGYDAEWEVVSAADVGAPHLRERVWILAYPSGERAHIQPVDFSESCTAPNSSGHGSIRHVADPAGARRAEGLCGTSGQVWNEARRSQPERRGPGFSNSHGEQHESGASANEWQASTELSADATCELQYGCGPGAEQTRCADGGWWSVEPNVGRVAHGIPARVDRLRGLGNAVVPQIPELYARRIAELLKAERNG